MTDVVETPDKNNEFMAKVRQMTVPVLLLINKIDLTDQEKLVKLVEDWKELLPQAEIIPISAASKFNVDYVMKRIKELLPDSPPYFGKDQWGQTCPFLCERDYPGKDFVVLRQGDSLFGRGGCGRIQGRSQEDSYTGSHLCGT
ncbi:hypothetical protein KUBF_48850 [Bacteroides finegoldii]|nr:hypothetical protein KUBF_48850 [Bacteroides finegoldii]